MVSGINTAMPRPSPHSILELPERASWDDVRRAFRKLSAENHPDTFAGLPKAERDRREEKFKAVSEAYTFLDKERLSPGDPEHIWDEEARRQPMRQQHQPPRPAANTQQRTSASGSSRTSSRQNEHQRETPAQLKARVTFIFNKISGFEREMARLGVSRQFEFEGIDNKVNRALHQDYVRFMLTLSQCYKKGRSIKDNWNFLADQRVIGVSAAIALTAFSLHNMLPDEGAAGAVKAGAFWVATVATLACGRGAVQALFPSTAGVDRKRFEFAHQMHYKQQSPN
ncbi:MAG: DnaJ domain-containing protein [Alphaproteobacteria bacterium]|nr:DnaJ domain-containing protein [Alphaproteobacteria bacterium]